MIEVITTSGTIIRARVDTPQQVVNLDTAVALFGGAVATLAVDTDRETVLQIMDQNVVGTTLTSADGTEYLLWNSGWVCNDQDIDLPPYESIISATMPGGWAWNV